MTAMRTSKSFVLDASGGADTYYTELFKAEPTARYITVQVQRQTGTGTVTATLQGGWASSMDNPMVPGTGYGVAELNALYIKTQDGPEVYLNSGDAAAPVWVADSGTLRSGAGAPTDGVTNGDTNDFYVDTTAYGSDPTTGWYQCDNGAADTWVAVTATVLAGATAPIDHVAAVLTDWANLDLDTSAIATDQLTELTTTGGDNYLFASFPCYRLKVVVGAAAATALAHVSFIP
jgi:hypothetical protein